MKKINKVEENSDLKPSVMSTEAAEPGGGAGEITPTHNSKNQDELLCVTISLLDTLDDLSQREGGASALADSRIAKSFEEKAPIKPTVSMTYHGRWHKTSTMRLYLQWRSPLITNQRRYRKQTMKGTE